MGGVPLGVLTRTDSVMACPECDTVGFTRMIGVASLPHINEYPRFDRGLNVLLTSEAHRQRVMRDKGVHELGGANDVDDLLSAQRGAEQAERAGRAARKAELERDPAYREYMRDHERQIEAETEIIRRQAREGRL
jgi:hypothetical protein